MTADTYAVRIRIAAALDRMTEHNRRKLYRYLRRSMYGSKPTVAGYDRYKAAAKAAFGGAKMTDAMLRLARAVYPDKPWQVDEERTIPFLGNGMYFYPEHFDSQFIDTLAWLACQTDVHINGECVATQHGIYKYEAGSGKGLAAAVVEAARRVVK